MRITLPPQKYNPAGIAAFFEALVDRVRSLPGTERASVATQFPPIVNFSTRVRIDGSPSSGAGALPMSLFTLASADYFATLRMTLAAGRLFDARDTHGAPQVAVVNETFARRYFAGGRRSAAALRWPARMPRARMSAGPKSWASCATYEARARRPRRLRSSISTSDSSNGGNQLFLRADERRPARHAGRRAARGRGDRSRSAGVCLVQTLDEAFGQVELQRRVTTVLVAAFGILALTLAGVGIYGVLACAVVARTREIAVRVALGADRRRVATRVTLDALLLVAVGLVAGLGGARLSVRSSSGCSTRSVRATRQPSRPSASSWRSSASPRRRSPRAGQPASTRRSPCAWSERARPCLGT